jgi:hypothetical protein
MAKLNLIGGQQPYPVGEYRTLYKYEGAYRSAYMIAKVRGEPLSSVVYRLEHGIELDAKPYATSHGRQPKRLLCNGVLMTVVEIAKATGYHITTVHRRSDGIRFFPRGEPTNPHEARPRIVETPYNEQYELDGIKDTLKGWAKRVGINYHTLYERVRVHRLPLALAIKAPVNTRTARLRNAKTVAKMAALFNKAADRTASAAQMATGGPSQTFAKCPATGPHSTECHLHGETP